MAPAKDDEVIEPDNATAQPRPKARPRKACSVSADFNKQLDYAHNSILAANAADPALFQFGGAYARVDLPRRKMVRIEAQNEFRTILRKVTTWEKTAGTGEKQSITLVAPPLVVSTDIFNDYEFSGLLPEVVTIAENPFFDRAGKLIDGMGYHADSKVYLARGADTGVSPVPSSAEVNEAKRLLIQEVLADFPLGGMDRTGIESLLKAPSENAHPRKNHALRHAIGVQCSFLHSSALS